MNRGLPLEQCMDQMKKPMIVVLATRNKGKTEEIRALLKDYPVELKNLDDFGPIPEVVEDGETFDDNAYKKSSFTRMTRYNSLPQTHPSSGHGTSFPCEVIR